MGTSQIRRLGLLTCSAALIVMPSQVPALWWGVFLAFLPARLALEGRSWSAWWWGGCWLWGLVFIGGYYWIYHVANYFGGLAPPVALAAVLAFALIHLWQGVVGFLIYAWCSQRISWPKPLLFALCLTASWHWIPGLFFGDLSVILRPSGWILQSVDIVGAIGLDLLLIFAGATLFECWHAKRMVRSAQIALALLCMATGYGAVRTHTIGKQLASAATLRTALIQPNIDSIAKSDPQQIHRFLRELLTLSDQAASEGAALIIWPEAIFPLDYERDPALRAILAKKTTEWNAWLLFGNNEFENRNDGGWRSYNAIRLIGPGGIDPQSYRKHVLLAFGEYLPFEDSLPFMRTWFPDRVGAFGRGNGPAPFHMQKTTFAPVVCYESIIADYIRKAATLPVAFITELTNDGWYGRTPALAYHKDLTVLRAMENRVGIARDTNTGITTYIDPLGREHGILPLEEANYTIVDIPQVRPFALATHLGAWPKRILGIFFLFAMLVSVARSPRENDPPPVGQKYFSR